MAFRESGRGKLVTVKIAINGAAGRMGQAVAAALALSDAAELVAAYDRKAASGSGVLESGAMDTGAFDVLIDFSTPAGALSALEHCAGAGRAAVVGTTGFDDAQRARAEEFADTIPVVIAPNMSTGMNLCFLLLRRAAQALGPGADVEIIEVHHRDKVDAPSGTALRMGEIVADVRGVDLARCAVYGRRGETGARSDQDVGFHSIRAGDAFGEHAALFSCAGEEIEIRHKALSRSAFAHGAVSAAVWVAGRPPGLYGMDDVLGF